MPLLYLETNFLMAVATGRLPAAAEILRAVPPHVQVVLPGVCVMESLIAVSREQSAANEFGARVQVRIKRIRESAQLAEFQETRARLEEAIAVESRALDEVQRRLVEALEALAGRAILLAPDGALVVASLRDLICTQPTDNLIFHSIVGHAAGAADPAKAFFTENIGDFLKRGGETRLRNSGISAFLGSQPALMGWLRAQQGPPQP